MKTGWPCSLCHFCARADMEDHGSVCVWYNVHIVQDDVHKSDARLRTMCAKESGGDNFVWRMENVGILDYAKWKQGIHLMAPARRNAIIAVVISCVSLISSIVFKFI